MMVRADIKGYCIKCKGPCYIRQQDHYAENGEIWCPACALRFSEHKEQAARGGYLACLRSPDQAYRDVCHCRLCDSANLTEALNLGETPLANELDGTELFPLVVNRCGACGHHQLSIAVAPERLWGPNYPYQSGTSPVFRKHLEQLADEVAAMKPGGTVLEIASNDGTLVQMLLDRRIAAWGMDPSGPHEGNLLRESWPRERTRLDGDYDVILALNVFAHVDDLHGFTAAVKEALAPDGVFIVEVGCAPVIWGRGVFDTIYHEHLSYHDCNSLHGFLKRHGLKVIRRAQNPSQGGSLRVYATHADEPEKHDRNLLAGMPQRIRHLNTDLQHATRNAKLICGYGAPAKLTTLAYTLDMPPIDCIGEDNPLKVGRTTPGRHIPIVSVADMLAKEPDCIIVFAWNFFDDIRDKLRRLGYAGDIVNPMGAA